MRDVHEVMPTLLFHQMQLCMHQYQSPLILLLGSYTIYHYRYTNHSRDVYIPEYNLNMTEWIIKQESHCMASSNNIYWTGNIGGQCFIHFLNLYKQNIKLYSNTNVLYLLICLIICQIIEKQINIGSFEWCPL